MLNIESAKSAVSTEILVTSRGTTIDKLNSLTPGATHLSGFGTSGRNTNGIEEWLKTINMME